MESGNVNGDDEEKTGERQPEPTTVGETQPETVLTNVEESVLEDTTGEGEENLTETARDRQIDQLEKNALAKHGAFDIPENWEDGEMSDEEDFATKYNLNKFIGEIDAEDEDVPQEEEEENLALTESNIDQMLKMLSNENSVEEEEGEGSAKESSLEGEQDPESEAIRTVGNESTTADDNPDKLLVLGPEHPKMKRFQKALEDHLRKQIYQVECETRQLENDIKLKKAERADMGNHLYSLQFELARQTEIIDKTDQELVVLVTKREEIESRTKIVKEQHDDIKNKLLKEQQDEKVLLKAVKQVDMMEWCVRQTAEEFDGELMIRQLIDDKIQKLRVEAEIQKRDQDFYLDKVLTHVQQMEQTNAGIQRQIQAHIDEQKDLTTMIAEAVTEIEALQMEKNHLQRAWNDTIAVVRARDEALNGARDALRIIKEESKNRDSELRALSRAIAKEQEEHEHMTVLLKRRRFEEKILRKQLDKVEEDKEHIMTQLNTLHEIKKVTEEELLRSNGLVARREKDIHEPRRKMEKLLHEKKKLEDNILHAIQEQGSLNKSATNITRKVSAIREKSRKLEAELVKVENDMTRITVEVEELRGQLLVRTYTLEDFEKKITDKEKMIVLQQQDLKQADRNIQKKTSEVEMLNKKLVKLIDAQGGVEVGPLEKEIEDLEKNNSLIKESCIELQEEWLKKQDDLVQLTSERDKMLHKNDILRKEVFIMERKKQRIEGELDKKGQEIVKLKKATDLIRIQIMNANGKLAKDINDSTEIERNNVLLEYELSCMLREAEQESVELQHDIEVMEEEKERLFRTLQESHEQCLQWEKKVRMVKELKNSLKVEQEGSGGALKLAIHHMQVRYNELRRAQEKLMNDMERSVEKRDRIIQQADYNLKRQNINPKKTKLNIQRSFNQIRERNKNLLKEAKEAEEEVESMKETIKALKTQLEEETKTLVEMKEVIKESEEKINNCAITKHKNLIEVILRQQKYKILESIKLHRYKPSMKSIQTIDDELRKVENKCLSLLELSDLLSHEYPEAHLHIKLIRASLLPHTK